MDTSGIEVIIGLLIGHIIALPFCYLIYKYFDNKIEKMYIEHKKQMLNIFDKEV